MFIFTKSKRFRTEILKQSRSLIRNTLRHISHEWYLAWRILCEFPEAPTSKWQHAEGWWKQTRGLCLSSLTPPPCFAQFLHTFGREGESGCMQFKFYLWKSTVKKGREGAFFLKESMLDAALWCSCQASLGKASQETDCGTRKNWVFAGTELFAGEIFVPQTQSLLQPWQLPVNLPSWCSFDMKEERRWLSPFALPSPSATAPSPHILQNHVDLLNRCVKLIILWVLGNQWIVNGTLLKQLQSSDWSIILWGMNKDKSFMCFRGLSCHHSAGMERKYQGVFNFFGFVLFFSKWN